MKKNRTEIESEKFWNDLFRQTKRQIRIAEKEEQKQKEEEKKQQFQKKGFFSRNSQGSNSQNDKTPYENSTHSFQMSDFEGNNAVTAIFKRISSANTATGAAKTGAYIGRIDREEEQALYYRGFYGNFEGETEYIGEISTSDNTNKAFLNACFEEEILGVSPTIGRGNEIESHHYIFSLPEYTRSLQNKVITKDKLNQILEEATKNTIKNNEILNNRAVLMAAHKENHAHLLFCATNFDGKKDLKYLTKAQQMDILRDFAKECRSLGLNVKIPQKEKPLNLQELNKIVNIEFRENDQIKAITLQNEQGATKRLRAVSINDFVVKNGLKINDKIAISIEKNQYGRNFYRLIEKEESQQEQEPPKIEVNKQKVELNSLQIAEAQRQVQLEIQIKEQERKQREQQEEKERIEREQKKAMENITENLQKYTIFYSNLKKDINFLNFEQDNKEKLKEIKNFSEKIKEIGKNHAKQIERVLTKTIER